MAGRECRLGLGPRRRIAWDPVITNANGSPRGWGGCADAEQAGDRGEEIEPEGGAEADGGNRHQPSQQRLKPSGHAIGRFLLADGQRPELLPGLGPHDRRVRG